MESYSLVKSEVVSLAFIVGSTTPLTPAIYNAGFPVSAVKIALTAYDGAGAAVEIYTLAIDNTFAGVFFSDTSVSGQNDPVLHKFPQPRLFEGQKTTILNTAPVANNLLVYITLTYYGNA